MIEYDDLINDINRDAKTEKGKPIPCERCKREWTPVYCNFYGLCDHCFNLFDQQKMNARFGSILEEQRIEAFENSNDWIKACPYVENEPSVAYSFQDQMKDLFAKLESEGKLKTVDIKDIP